MLAFTLVYRYSDALALSADVEGASGGNPASPISSSSSSPTNNNAPPPLTSLKNTAKSVLRRLSPGAQGGVTSQNYFSGGQTLLQIDMQNEASFVVLLDQGVLFLTVNCASGCPGHPGSHGAVSLAAAYLEEIAREFGDQFGQQVNQATRPFPFLRFDNFLSKTKKVYLTRGIISGGNVSSSGSHGGSNATGDLHLRRAGAQMPSKISFYKLMGFVEPQTPSGAQRLGNAISSQVDDKTMLYLAIGVIVAAAFVIMLFVLYNVL